LSYFQNIDQSIKDHCKKEGFDFKKLPFKPDDYNFVSQKSTFLDIGSGFGKPNFHAALQVFPKESIGVEVVEARVSYSIDQRYKFEEYYQRLKAKNAVSFSNISNSNSSSCVNNNQLS
jgi:tRNA G46 methylase TrmB